MNMMKKYILSYCFILLTISGFAQEAHLSANLRQYLLKNQIASSNIVLNKHNGQDYFGAIIEITPNFDESLFAKYGVSVGTKIGNYRTVQIPVSQIRNFVQLKNIKAIQLDEPIGFTMDAARRVTRVDSVHLGINLPTTYSGKNVVVGIIDAGFDYTHPTFYDTTGTRLRIKKIWEQKNDGTPPKGYTYGNEITDTTQMLNEGAEINSFSHGTHVGGIAAGSGYIGPNNKKYRGIAYESDLVFVGIRPEKSEWKGMGMSSILDGINYIFNYAKEQNKPAVVNLSWGCSIGPNDGSSLFSKACDLLTGEGRIFVLSAGNNGEENLHLQKDFSVTDTLVNSFIDFPTINGEKRTWLDIWGDSSNQFCLELNLMKDTLVSSKTEVFCLTQLNQSSYLIGSAGDTCFYTISTTAADHNGRPHIFVDLFSKTNDKLLMKLLSSKGRVNAWLGFVHEYVGYEGNFISNGFKWAVNGDNSYTLGEMACTKNALTVAAYASKVSWRNLAGSNMSYSGYTQTGRIVPFSSHGPTADGRNKPDIAAPGMTLASAVNSFDVSYAPGGGNYDQSVAKYTSPKNNRDYYYAEASGTSMSSPMMSGIVALMLQVNPKLDPGRLKQILAETAIIDNFTTPTPDPTRWGFGKVNAYAAIKKTIQTLGLSGELQEGVLLNLYPNPTNRKLYIDIESNQSKILDVVLMDLNGKKLKEQNWNTGNESSLVLDLEGLQEAIYLVQIKSDTGIITRRIIVSTP